MKSCFSIIIAIILVHTAIAAETNKVFFTNDGFPYSNREQKIAAARKSKEGLPADQFPEGNWGMPTNGYQLSLRFDKTSYSLGEPITATILLRNITNQVLTYKVATVFGQDGPIGFNVRKQEGVVRPIPLDIIDVVSVRDVTLVPESQHKYVERLDKRYNLTNGVSYVVHAAFRANCPDCFEVTSADVKIKIAE